jgi:hypothetical protein
MGRLRPEGPLTTRKALRGRADSYKLALAKLRLRVEVAEIRRKLRAAGEAGLGILALVVLLGILANVIDDRCSRARHAEQLARDSRYNTQAQELKR